MEISIPGGRGVKTSVILLEMIQSFGQNTFRENNGMEISIHFFLFYM